MILKADIDTRARDLGFSVAQVTPTLRASIWSGMLDEAATVGALRLCTAVERLAAAQEAANAIAQDAANAFNSNEGRIAAAAEIMAKPVAPAN